MRSFIRNVGTAGIYNELEETMAGQIIFCASSVIPNGYLECNGATVSRTTYATLFAAIGSLYGAGDGATTFALPDLRGEFLRGADRGRGVDSGRAVGSGQSDQNKAHTHQFHTAYRLAGGTPAFDGGAISGNSGTPSGLSNFNAIPEQTTSSAGNAEARPRNVALIPVIKY